MRQVLTAALVGLLLSGCQGSLFHSQQREMRARADAAETLNAMCQDGDTDACIALFERGVRVEDRREE